jgi:hypothetical protein
MRDFAHQGDPSTRAGVSWFPHHWCAPRAPRRRREVEPRARGRRSAPLLVQTLIGSACAPVAGTAPRAQLAVRVGAERRGRCRASAGAASMRPRSRRARGGSTSTEPARGPGRGRPARRRTASAEREAEVAPDRPLGRVLEVAASVARSTSAAACPAPRRAAPRWCRCGLDHHPLRAQAQVGARRLVVQRRDGRPRGSPCSSRSGRSASSRHPGSRSREARDC